MKRSTEKREDPEGPTADHHPGTWRDRSLRELAAAQGVRLPQDTRELLGAGADLWESDEELEQFIEALRQHRR